MKSIIVSSLESNQRIDKFVRKYLNEAPLSFIYRLFRKKDVKVNGHWVKENYIIQTGETISIYVTDSQLDEFNKPKEAIKADFRHEIIFEDENILIVNKPRGLLVHGDESEKRNTLANDVLNYLYYKEEYNPRENKGFIPAPAHRLDRNTSGLVMFAKNLESLQTLENLIKDKTNLVKTYQALVVGKINEQITIDKPLFKDARTGMVRVGDIERGAQNALSIVTPNKNYGNYSLVNVELVTGRTHQIRVHLASVGHPIIGDGKYGDFATNRVFKERFNFENQFLHAMRIEFKKIDGKLSYLSNRQFLGPLPKDEIVILKKLGN